MFGVLQSLICVVAFSMVMKATAKSEPLSHYDLQPGLFNAGSFENVQELLRTGGGNTVEEFLARWKSKDPVLFRYYLLAYHSRSLQSASPEYPRVILFHPTGEFAASFNGHSSQRGYQQIEMYRFNHLNQRFEFYELSFFKNKKPSLSEANPQKCLDCHQSLGRETADPRPNWEPYFLWPGFYGSMSGVFKESVQKLSANERQKIRIQEDAQMLADIPLEQPRYDFFMTNIRPHHARYQVLEDFDPIRSREEADLFGLHAAQELKPLMYTQRVSQLNFLRVARLMQEDPAVFDYLKEALVAVLNCTAVQLPRDFVAWLFQHSSLATRYTQVPTVFDMGGSLRLLFEPFYVETDDWSMDFKTEGRFAFSHRFGTPGRPAFEMMRALKELSPEVQSLSQMNCASTEFLKKIEKYKDIQKAVQLQAQRIHFKERLDKVKNTPLLQRCIACHVSPSGRDVPAIPFDQPDQLKLSLQKTGYPRGTLLNEIVYRTGAHATSAEQMPPRGIPTDYQRQVLLQYLQSL